MDFKRIPSLEYLSGIKISHEVIYHTDMRRMVIDSDCSDFAGILRDVFGILDDSISNLNLPTECSKKIRDIILNMLRELTMWMNELDDVLISFPQRWMIDHSYTTLGSIDRVQTARKMLQGSYISTESRFLLTCKLCLFHDGISLWNAMPVAERPRLKRRQYFLYDWIHFRGNEIESLDFAYFFQMFIVCLEQQTRGNEYELRLVLEYKTPFERQAILRKEVLRRSTITWANSIPAASRNYHLLYCFQQMDEDSQLEVLESQPFVILMVSLTWPFQNRFLDVFDRVRTSMSPLCFMSILDLFLHKLKEFNWQNLELFEIFKEFWHRCPAYLRDFTGQRQNRLINILINCNSLESLITNSPYLNS